MYQIDFNHPIHVYFIGIGGISMSGLARILLSENFTVSGSDRQMSELTESLSSLGAIIYYGQRAENCRVSELPAGGNGALHGGHLYRWLYPRLCDDGSGFFEKEHRWYPLCARL